VNDGAGQFTFSQWRGTASGAHSLAPGDLSGDGFDDLLAPRAQTRGFAYAKGSPTGVTMATILPTGMAPIWAEFADWTGDGRVDIAMANNLGSISLLVQGSR
jgi:hypothetical protein